MTPVIRGAVDALRHLCRWARWHAFRENNIRQVSPEGSERLRERGASDDLIRASQGKR